MIFYTGHGAHAFEFLKGARDANTGARGAAIEFVHGGAGRPKLNFYTGARGAPRF